MEIKFPYRVPAIRVEQPLGIYYVAVLPAKLLLDVSYSDILCANLSEDGRTYTLDGTQRLAQPKRLQPIAEYINRIDCAFPNSIILAANFRREDGLIEDDEQDGDGEEVHVAHARWVVDFDTATGQAYLTIPSNDKLAAIIDGQHRVFAFAYADKARLAMDMICSIFLDLPKPFQAQLFATINSTQTPVNKSLTYELFGYNINDEPEEYWSPDKLAVYLSRKLAVEDGSPLQGRIKVAPKRDSALESIATEKNWMVSTAVVVEGIMRLITTNPKRDAAKILGVTKNKRMEIGDYRKDKSPLRQSYINTEDSVIYQIALNYLRACETVFWSRASQDSFIKKTVGIQALFDILRLNVKSVYEKKDIRVAHFVEMLMPAGSIDFSTDQFRNASGSGRSMIRRAIEEAMQEGAAE